jgi:tRNA modification GTPase
VVDTAGLRESNDEVERIGVARSWGEIGDADVVVFLHDLSRVGDPAYDADDARLAERLASQQVVPGHRIDVYNKADIAAAAVPSDGLRISARTGQGLDTLAGRLLEMAGWRAEPEGVFIARTRHLDALQRTAEHLRLAEAHALQRDAALELFAEELRLAHDALGEITGAFTPDDLLGVIFSRFCIGK